MVRILAAVFLLGACSASAYADDITVVDHDAVSGFAEQSARTNEQKVALTFRPYLWVVNGCVPFPAVNSAGEVGGGLAPTGGSSAGCSSSTGQVYVRSAWYNGAWAIMYAWYMPKDEPSSGLGHRHDWENAVVWIDDPDSASPAVLAVSVSQHGSYSASLVTGVTFSGTHPLIKYQSYWPVNHALFLTDTLTDGTQPLIHWSQLTAAAQHTLTDYDYGSANVPFKDANFDSNLEAAWYE